MTEDFAAKFAQNNRFQLTLKKLIPTTNKLVKIDK